MTLKFFLTVTLAHAGSVLSSAGADDVIGKAGNKWCHEAHYLSAIKQKVTREINDRTEATARNDKILRYWTIAQANAQTQDEEDKFRALLLYGNKVQRQNLRTLADLQSKAATLTTAIEQRLYVIPGSELLQTTFKLADPTTNPTGGNTAVCTQKLTVAAETAPSCTLSTGKPLTALEPSNTALQTAEKIKLGTYTAAASMFAPPQIVLNAGGANNAWHSTQDTAGTCKTGNSGTAINPGTDHIAVTVKHPVQPVYDATDEEIKEGTAQFPQPSTAKPTTGWTRS
uniref:Variant surface glycoprotein 1814 n=1 Tax=Trypanosoma brucei TaxID=5691 RepID=M4SWF5_9TRYP|nr:variant surface glycoprotein 1814 [Trypanosoma brucei]